MLLPGRDGRAKAGHPWVFSNEIHMNQDLKALLPGSLVTVATSRGEALGTYTFNHNALICCRKLSSSTHAKIDTSWALERLRHALARRSNMATYCRLIHSEGDLMPGLVIDRFGDVLVAQVTTAGMEHLKPVLRDALQQLLAPKAILWRQDTQARALENLPMSDEVEIDGTLPAEALTLQENGLTFVADVQGGQKTGWFYDQRANRAFMRQIASGLPEDSEVLDVYCHIGGFGLNMLAGGAARATLVDASNQALSLARDSAHRQGMDARIETIAGPAFDVMEDMAARNRRFGAVVCDPPAFIKSAKTMAAGLKGYEKVAKQGAALVKGGGYLTLCSCSHHASVEDFVATSVRGIRRAGRSGRILRLAGADTDHPQHLMLAENGYLKCLTVQLD
jgi:23S rRNA (cytosine1962-C5)-methyltransferase